MNKTLMIIIAVVVLFVGIIMSGYNSLVSMNEKRDRQMVAIENHCNAVTNLSPTWSIPLKAMLHTKATVFKAVADARAKLGGAKTVAETSQANGELSGALSRLLMVAENYPDLKANANFTQLQDELAGTENRIAVARMDYNNAVQGYNAKIKSFPTVLYAGMFGFDARDYFKADESAKAVPQVQF